MSVLCFAGEIKGRIGFGGKWGVLLNAFLREVSFLVLSSKSALFWVGLTLCSAFF